jgi:hypothetical protein
LTLFLHAEEVSEPLPAVPFASGGVLEFANAGKPDRYRVEVCIDEQCS